MPAKYPSDLLEQAHQAAQAMQHIDSSFKIGEISLAALENSIGLATNNQQQISSLEAQLTDLRNQRDDINTTLWDVLKRLRGGIKAAYGDNSSQHEMMGGKRSSERKKPSRKAPPAA